MINMRYGIFTKPRHIEQIVNYLNEYTDVEYFISTNPRDVKIRRFSIGISYCFPHILDVHNGINRNRKWFNYHPAPLPEYRLPS